MAIQTNNQYRLKVYVWDTIVSQRELGHVSLAIQKKGADKDSLIPTIKRRHFGFYPYREVALSDLPFPVPARVKKSLRDEVCYSAQGLLFVPDRCYEIVIDEDQYKEIKNAIKKHSDNIQSGKIRYAGLPPITSSIHRTLDSDFTCELENCATMTTKILKSGGISINETSTLWGITPTDVSNQLKDLISRDRIKGEVFSISKPEKPSWKPKKLSWKPEKLLWKPEKLLWKPEKLSSKPE